MTTTTDDAVRVMLHVMITPTVYCKLIQLTHFILWNVGRMSDGKIVGGNEVRLMMMVIEWVEIGDKCVDDDGRVKVMIKVISIMMA